MQKFIYFVQEKITDESMISGAEENNYGKNESYGN